MANRLTTQISEKVNEETLEQITEEDEVGDSPVKKGACGGEQFDSILQIIKRARKEA